MTVEVNDCVDRMLISGVGPYPFTFRIFSETDLQVVVDTGALDPALLTISTHYTVEFDDEGGEVTLTAGAAALYAGDTLDIRSNTTESQPSSLRSLGINPGAYEEAIDRLERQIQDLRRASRRALRLPDTVTIEPVLQPLSSWAGKYVYINGSGVPEPATAIATTVLTAAVITDLTQPQTAVEAVLGITPQDKSYPECHLFRYLTNAERTNYVASLASVDITIGAQQCINVAAGRTATFPKGFGKITTALAVAAPTIIQGDGDATRIHHWACNGVNISSGGSGSRIRDIFFENYTAGGAADPKTQDNISINGTAIAPVVRVTIDGCYLQGANRAINQEYSSYSTITRTHTTVCNYGLRYFGQCVNVVVGEGCDLQTVGGTACIYLQKDGGTVGEGLMVTGSLLGSASYGILADGFLSIGVDPSVLVDVISLNAFNFTGVTSFMLAPQWVFSTRDCLVLADVGGDTNVAGEVSGGTWQTTGDFSCFTIGVNNRGVKLAPTTVIKSGAGGGYPFLLKGQSPKVIGSHIVNGTSNPAIRIETTAGTDAQILGITGDTETEWETTPIPTVASSGTITLPDPKYVPLNVINITGTTSITAINGLAAYLGRGLITFQFNDVLTFTDGAGSIDINGNFVTSAGDTITGYSTGTAFREVGRAAN